MTAAYPKGEQWPLAGAQPQPGGSPLGRTPAPKAKRPALVSLHFAKQYSQSFFQGEKFHNFLLPSKMELLLNDRAEESWSLKAPNQPNGQADGQSAGNTHV